MSKIAIYAGTFDPITNGHLDIIERSLLFCDKLIVGVGINYQKKTMFSEDERVRMIGSAIGERLNKNLDEDQIPRDNWLAKPFFGLLVEFARQSGANVLIRGIRSVSDFEYEINLANINHTLAPDIQTIFLPTRPELAIVSSSMVKELARNRADISKYVPNVVANEVYKILNPIKET